MRGIVKTPRRAEASATAAWFLVGPTAVGKTLVGHHLARQEGADILSADAMLVYRGMDIGTDKPTAQQRREVHYWGIDLVTPDRLFSVGAYLEHARQALRQARAESRPVIVVGGSGLYLKSLTHGLAPLPGADEAIRAWAEEILRRKGLAGLQEALRSLAPDVWREFPDKENPRRLVRALELVRLGQRPPGDWSGRRAAPLVGLRMPPELLRARIRERVERMFRSGLVDEVRELEAQYGPLSRTALQAIGYREARAVGQGRLLLAQAIQETFRRTCQLAKRQMTWFRHQAQVIWVDVGREDTVETVAARVRTLWKEYGPTPTAC